MRFTGDIRRNKRRKKWKDTFIIEEKKEIMKQKHNKND